MECGVCLGYIDLTCLVLFVVYLLAGIHASFFCCYPLPALLPTNVLISMLEYILK